MKLLSKNQNLNLKNFRQRNLQGTLPPDLNAPQHPDPQGSLSPHSPESPQLSPEVSASASGFSNYNEPIKTIYDHLENPIYDDEEIIKTIKINELTKNVNSSKRQKDRSNTIIEVHMEVLEECRNEDWENNKEAFLEICIDELAKENYRTNPNLTDDDLIKENIKSSNDIKKQNIKWNKCIERYRNLSEKLKKVLTEKLQSISEECVSEETINYISLINVEELQHKENYKELYKYIKKKLLTKMCILVLMSILEECTKEVNFDNRESYLDSSINEWKAEVYSGNKQEITENIIEYNNNDIKNKRNKELHAHIGNENFRNEIEDWTRENDIYANSIVNDGTIKKSHDITERHTS
ncbi:hypothetical protein MKS88_001261 [Plasmodium brasilianum]|uniref:Uncharacterized protein n=1 Tax=Plasmodium brasilianum TaxID=5824 RepID=A0ACB9YF55_PLABR|nr:hypothetical protein MKS88_001261 [Plasmodium brasilianum]